MFKKFIASVTMDALLTMWTAVIIYTIGVLFLLFIDKDKEAAARFSVVGPLVFFIAPRLLRLL